MTVYILSSVRMHLDSQGLLRTSHGAAAYEAWAPYLQAFGQVTVLARVLPNKRLDEGQYAEGPGVTVQPLPFYEGARGALVGLSRIRRYLGDIGVKDDIFILRLPEVISLFAANRAHKVGASLISLLVAEPEGIRYVLKGLPGKLLATVLAWRVRQVVQWSDGVVYVTEQYFQDQFPARSGVPTLSRSNVVLPESWIASTPKELLSNSVLKLLYIATQEHQAKGNDFLIDVVRKCKDRGLRVSLSLAGGGRLEKQLRAQALSAGVDVQFTGQMHDRAELRSLIASADVYVSGSRTEGLPRATIEAMAVGLPVVSTRAGAISELIDSSMIVDIDDVSGFVNKLSQLASDRDLYRRLSEENIDRAALIAQRAAPERFAEYLTEFRSASVENGSLRNAE